MLPPLAASELVRLGHDAVSVIDIGMGGDEDPDVMEFAVVNGRVVVPENFADSARLVQQRRSADMPCVPVVFVRRDAMPRRGALAAHLARRLDTWATENPEPFTGVHWP